MERGRGDCRHHPVRVWNSEAGGRRLQEPSQESLDAAGLGTFSALPHCYLCSLLQREMLTHEDVGASCKMRL